MKRKGILFNVFVAVLCLSATARFATADNDEVPKQQQPESVLLDNIVSTIPVPAQVAVTNTMSNDAEKTIVPATDTSTVLFDPQPKPNTTTPADTTTGEPTTTELPPTTTTAAPDTTTTLAPNTTTMAPNTTTVAPNTTTAAPDTTSVAPDTTTTLAPTSTTVDPANSTTTLDPVSTTTYAPDVKPARRFDGASFIGGMVLAIGLMCIGLVAWKFYRARTERNYHTL